MREERKEIIGELANSKAPLFHILGVIDPFAETKSPVSVSSAGLEQIHVSRIL